MKTHFQKIPFLFSVLMILASVFVFTTLYLETMGNHTKAEETIVVWQAERNHREEIKSLERSVIMYERERALLETHFARSSDVVPFLNGIEDLARSVGAEPEITSVEAVEETEVLEVSMSTSGKFESLHKFLMLLENSHYEIEFTSVDMSLPGAANASNSNTNWELTLDFKLLTFVN